MARSLFTRLHATAFVAVTVVGQSLAATIRVPADRPTIAAGIAAAQANDTVQIAAGTYQERLTVDKSLILQGDTAGETIIEPDADGRVFAIAAGTTVQMNDLTVQKGLIQHSGAAIYNAGALTLTRCVIRDNRSQGNGAGLFSDWGSTLSIQGCVFERNIIESPSQPGGAGGAIYTRVPLTMSDTTVRNNSSNSSSAGVMCLPSAKVERCTFTGNLSPFSATLFVGGGGEISDCTFVANLSRDYGVALTVFRNAEVTRCTFRRNGGGAVYTSSGLSGRITLTDCTFVENTGSLGGALVNRGDLTLQGCTFSSNVANSWGGAVFSEQGMLTVRDSTFNDNRAGAESASGPTGGGGAITVSRSGLRMTGCRMMDNTGSYQAGAIMNEEGDVSLTDCTIDGSHAGGGGYGGAIVNVAFSGESKASLALTRCAFTGNTGQYGGALYNLDGAATLYDCVFKTNTVSGHGQGGAVLNIQWNPENTAHLFIARSRFFDNVAANHAGALINIDGEAYVVDSTFTENRADGTGQGGAILNVGQRPIAPAVLTMSRTTLVANTAANDGGVLYNEEGIVRLTNCTLSDNRALGSGNGGAAVNISKNPGVASLLTLVNCTVAGNTSATENGGGIVTGTGAGPATTRLMNTLLAGNTAPSLRATGGSQIVSEGYNMSTDAPASLNQASDRTNTEPRLGPLADNGGATMTCALLEGSPAIDAGNAAGAPSSDQRFFTRRAGAGVDIGAFEYASVLMGFTMADAAKALRIHAGLEALTLADVFRLDLASGDVASRITDADAIAALRRLSGME